MRQVMLLECTVLLYENHRSDAFVAFDTREFGNLCEKTKTHNVLSLCQQMQIAEESPNKTALALEPHALVNFTDYFKKIYNLGQDLSDNSLQP